MRKCKKIFTLLAILWMAAIFFFSSRNADESTAQSNRAGMLAGHLLVRDFDSWTEQEQLDFAKKIDHPVRKTAHASEYALLGMLLFGAMTGTRKIRMGYAWLAASCYAVTDEFHQLFVPGRSCQFTDVCIDSGGAALGILVAAGVSLLVFRIREWRSQNL